MFRQMAIIKHKTFVIDQLTSTKITCFFNLSRVKIVKFYQQSDYRRSGLFIGAARITHFIFLKKGKQDACQQKEADYTQ